MADNNSTSKTREKINERIMMYVRKRTISIEVSEELIELCTNWKTTPRDLLRGFVNDVLLDASVSPDYSVLFHQAAQHYLYIAHGRARIIKGGAYTERPAPRVFN